MPQAVISLRHPRGRDRLRCLSRRLRNSRGLHGRGMDGSFRACGTGITIYSFFFQWLQFKYLRVQFKYLRVQGEEEGRKGGERAESLPGPFGSASPLLRLPRGWLAEGNLAVAAAGRGEQSEWPERRPRLCVCRGRRSVPGRRLRCGEVTAAVGKCLHGRARASFVPRRIPVLPLRFLRFPAPLGAWRRAHS